MMYPVVVHNYKNRSYGVTVPDLEECFSAGSTPSEALDSAKEAIVARIALLEERGEEVPPPSEYPAVRANAPKGVWYYLLIPQNKADK